MRGELIILSGERVTYGEKMEMRRYKIKKEESAKSEGR